MKKIFLMALTVAFLSCGTDDNNSSQTELKLVTGVNFRQTMDDVPLQLGNPNVLTGNRFVAFPNPANEFIYVAAQGIVSDVWVIPANPRKVYQGTDFGSILNSELYSESILSDKSLFKSNGQSSQDLSLNIGALPKGYYRLFAKIDGMIFWDNIYVNGAEGGNEQEIQELISFWQ